MDSTKFFYVPHCPSFFLRLELIFENQLGPSLVRHFRLQVVTASWIVPEGYVDMKGWRKQNKLPGLELNVATALELFAYCLQWLFPYLTVMDGSRSVKSLHYFDLCQEFGVRAEILQELCNPWRFARSLVGKGEPLPLNWPTVEPGRRMQLYTAFVVQ